MSITHSDPLEQGCRDLSPSEHKARLRKLREELNDIKDIRKRVRRELQRLLFGEFHADQPYMRGGSEALLERLRKGETIGFSFGIAGLHSGYSKGMIGEVFTEKDYTRVAAIVSEEIRRINDGLVSKFRRRIGSGSWVPQIELVGEVSQPYHQMSTLYRFYMRFDVRKKGAQ